MSNVHSWGRRWQIGATLGAIVALAAVGYVGGRELSSQARADRDFKVSDLPGPNDTPEPGSTPDRERPFWYVPYLNQERDAPKFRGEKNGIIFDDADSPAGEEKPGEVCEGLHAPEDWQSAVAGTPFAVRLDNLPRGVKLLGEPMLLQCGDGSPLNMSLLLQIEGGIEGVGPAGSAVYVDRVAGTRAWPNLYSPDRLSSGEVAGHPAVFVSEVADGFGDVTIFIVDEESNGSTRVRFEQATMEFAKSLAEDLYR